MSKGANDLFEVYFTEKLWEMIPPLYRFEDSRDENPDKGVLRSLIELMAEQAAILRRSTDQLWDDQFIELCHDWAVPYIADLIGTRLVSSLNKRGRRTDVAKTIYYRRRKGTLRVQEELIRDITGWDGKVVEIFKRLARFRHNLDPKPGLLAGLLTQTPPGGWADIRDTHGSELVSSPFDEFHHTADIRRHNGTNGLYGINRLAFHLYTSVVTRVVASTPFTIKEGESYGFDPSGRNIPLYLPDYRPPFFDWDHSWHSAHEWEIASPMSCNLLSHEEYLVDNSVIRNLVNNHGLSVSAANDLHKILNLRCRNETRFRILLRSLPSGNELTDPAVYLPLIAQSLIKDCGKSILLENAVRVSGSNGAIAPELISPGYAEAWDKTSLTLKQLIIDPENGRFLFTTSPAQPDENLTVSYYSGSPAPIGAGTYQRTPPEEPGRVNLISGGHAIMPIKLQNNRLNRIADSLTYTAVPDKTAIGKLVLSASDGQRPYFSLQQDWILEGAGEESELCLDGLWMGSSVPNKLILRGNYKLVTIRYSTVDPGGDTNLKGDPIYPVTVLIDGNVDHLIIDSCFTGPVHTGNTGHIENTIIRDSVIQSVTPGVPAIDMNEGVINAERITVLGDVKAHRMIATDTLIAGNAQVTDNQYGCFRFSAAGEMSRLPHLYESALFPFGKQNWFISRRFGQPGYARPGESAPGSLRTGSENGSEIGAFCNQRNILKLNSLLNKLEEYMPFGLIPVFICHT